MRFIFVTWWVISWLWKWIAAASIGKLLKSAGHSVNIIKLDPYLQVDAGTMSPYEHGEVFVTEDWFETDLDLGHYERFLNQNLDKNSSITTGQIYQHIISNERKWAYLWETVQVIPHVTDEVKRRIFEEADRYDVTILEIGGTIGDIEGPHFIEAARQMRKDVGRDKTMYIHVAPVLYLSYSGEMKTKPIQHSVRELTRLGIQADMLLCRTEHELTVKVREKLALFCDIEENCIIEALDVESIYQVPELFRQQWVDQIVQERLWLTPKPASIDQRNSRTNNFLHPEKTVRIWMVGKYTEVHDAYLSVVEALKHAGAFHKTKIEIQRVWLDELQAGKVDWFLIPWWFWTRGMEEKIAAAQVCREQWIPYLGLCLGLQMAVIEFARNVCWLEHAHSVEAQEDWKSPVISRMPGQSEELKKWWTMRLGTYTTLLKEWSLTAKLYGKKEIVERHRHRFEVNPDFYELLENDWLVLSWKDKESWLVEFIELEDHPFFVATQAHPEFKSRLDDPHPLFVGFVAACLRK